VAPDSSSRCPNPPIDDPESSEDSGIRRVPAELLEGRVESWFGAGAEVLVRRRGDLLVVTLRGALIADDAAALHSVALMLEAAHDAQVTVDLRGVHRACPDAIAAFRPLFRRATAAPSGVRFVGVHGQPLALLTRLQLQRLVALEP
jgi:anti-anti-sigma regulatory factor